MEDVLKWHPDCFRLLIVQCWKHLIVSLSDLFAFFFTLRYRCFRSSGWQLSEPRVRARKVGEMRKAFRENQHQRLELRDEEGGTSTAMPVSFSIIFFLFIFYYVNKIIKFRKDFHNFYKYHVENFRWYYNITFWIFPYTD